MAVKVRKLRGSHYVVIDYKGQRKTKHIGTLSAARDVAKKIEAKLALKDMSVFDEDKPTAQTFKDYADKWKTEHLPAHNKPSTVRVYGVAMDNHILPVFGAKRLDAITDSGVEDFIASLLRQQKDGAPAYTQRTIALITAALRSFLTYCQHKKQIAVNPAKGLGKQPKSQKPARDVESMTKKERDSFLKGIRATSPEMYPLFLCAVRAGLRRGELCGLQWGDITLGADEDSDRYLWVQRSYSGHYSYQGYGTTKSGKCRRVDIASELRGELLSLRDAAMLKAMQAGKDSIDTEPVFADADGKPHDPAMLESRYMKPALAFAGLRRFTPHCLRHTFTVLLLQAGAPLKYVSEQLGHSSIMITASIYGKFQPGENLHFMDLADSKPQTHANRTQTQEFFIPKKGTEHNETKYI